MRKLTFILIMTLCLTFISCNNDYNNESIQNVSTSNRYSVDKVKIDNHDYIVAKTIVGLSYGISIIHSESCECKKRK